MKVALYFEINIKWFSRPGALLQVRFTLHRTN
jgi:hypothetical protein